MDRGVVIRELSTSFAGDHVMEHARSSRWIAVALSAIAIGCVGELSSRSPRRRGGPGSDPDPAEVDAGRSLRDAGARPAPEDPIEPLPPDPEDDAGPDTVVPTPPDDRPDAGPRDAGARDAGPPPPVDPGPCTYPPSTSRISMGSTITPYRWATAYQADGTRVTFDLRELHCGEAYAAYSSLLIVVGTAWCPNCPQYLRDVAAMNLESTGTLVLWLESQNSSYETASSDEARRTVDRVIGTAPGIRAGERDSSVPDGIGSQTGAVPSGYFVRLRDMRVLADEIELGRTPPYQEMSRDPERDWVGILTGRSACTEEPSEPNDTQATAAAIPAGSFDGGVCTSSPDWYQVSIAGRWRMDLAFSHADGDIDVYAIDAAGATIATSDSADDDESITVTGPARVRVEGWRGATAAYRLTLTEL